MRPVPIPSRRDDVSSRPTARSARPVRVRYSHTSASTARTTTPMNASGTKLDARRQRVDDVAVDRALGMVAQPAATRPGGC